jgi:hypothetical protein
MPWRKVPRLMLVCNLMSFPSAFVPRPRQRGVVSQTVDGETLLYVEETHQATCLNAPAARIWALCDGDQTLEQIALGSELDVELVARAMVDLGAAGLLENSESRGANQARRRMLGVGRAAIPLILVVMAPIATQPGSPCTPSGSACNGGTPPCCAPTICVPSGNPTCS